jgi:hypothetical protein
MTKQDFDKFLSNHAITYNSVKIEFIDGTYKIGYFERGLEDYEELRQKNLWMFVENNNSVAYKVNVNDPNYTTIINGDLVKNITVL